MWDLPRATPHGVAHQVRPLGDHHRALVAPRVTCPERNSSVSRNAQGLRETSGQATGRDFAACAVHPLRERPEMRGIQVGVRDRQRRESMPGEFHGDA